PAADQVSEVALIVSLLALPVTNVAYFLMLVPVLLVRRWTRPTAMAGIILLVPWQFFMSGRLPWPYAIALFSLLVGFPLTRPLRSKTEAVVLAGQATD
ncbi:MAG TPA: hypothetical protein VKT80_02555, partial [Chloroflexota bacterium]|nr:hypothetical protein [Chloroflexota bacterium]